MNKKHIVLLITTFCLFGSLSAFGQQDQGNLRVRYFNSHKYTFVPDKVRWRDANKRAEEMDGHLVTITSKEEQAFIEELLKTQKDSGNCTWLGFSDDEKEGQWQWVTGEEVKFTNWGPGQPDNGYGCQNYAWIGWYGNGLWDDNSEGAKLPFIVEIDSASSSSGRRSNLRSK